MLQLKNIKKNYAEGENQVRALRGISLNFRKSEFVSILGPSGCGKTTMLNIIGGLDQYTEGDLIIGGRSTKGFKDRDWDSYRNHSIGFVFQSYNLIPHQSVLQNVEIALSLSGVPKKERRRRAREALEAVGLGDQLKKRPGEMSGGQMQRVAIARALVNNPDIILADEPTGALDTETSVQVMEILKEVARDRLVIMVTHNPDLAEKYSTRIIRMLDGEILDDSDPLTGEELRQMEDSVPAQPAKREKKPSMSFGTAFALSLKNLFTKKGRTTLTAFAGSIGIIGIALIYAVSQGTTNYIAAVQEDTLSSYPLTLQASTVDMSTLLQTFAEVGEDAFQEHPLDAVYSQPVMFEMIGALANLESTENDLASFKTYLEAELADPEGTLDDTLSGVQYTYDLDLQVYTESVDGKIIRSDTQELLTEAIAQNMGADMSSMLSMQESMGTSMGSMFTASGGMSLWCEMLSDKDGGLISPLIGNQYELVSGSWPNEYNEIVLVVNERNELSDMTLYALGLKSEEEINSVFQAVAAGTEVETSQQKWTYEQIMDMRFRVVLNSDCYYYNEATGLYLDWRNSEEGLRYLYDSDSAIDLRVTGIIRPREEAASAMLAGSIAYTGALTEYVARAMESSDVIRAQQAAPDKDILTGLPFRAEEGSVTNAQKQAAFLTYAEKLDIAQKAAAYVKIMGILPEDVLTAQVREQLAQTTPEVMSQTLVQVLVEQMSISESDAMEYVTSMDTQTLTERYTLVLTASIQAQAMLSAQQQYGQMDPTELAAMLDAALPGFTEEQCAQYYDQVLEFSESTYEQNLTELGSVDLASPATVNLYASSFQNKDVLEDFIADYNSSVEELKQIRYTDYVGLIMSSVTTIIDAITYVLIAFVSISLIVSSIMIGVITLISVQERTKEIGILRAIGASKRNVSSMFNAETVIIGFASGVLGVAVTWLLCIPINAIIRSLTGIPNLKAELPWQMALILVTISVLLTLISGLIPSRSAAKKDPVVALRTE